MSNVSRFPRQPGFFARWQEVVRLLDAGNRAAAFQKLETLADDGYVEAFAEMGYLFEREGNEVPADLQLSYQWYSRAVDEADDSDGRIGIARLILNGFTSAGSIKDAVCLLEIAIAQGNPVAKITLGAVLHKGDVVPQDLLTAKRYYDAAIQNGYVAPYHYLAQLLAEQGHLFEALSYKIKGHRLAKKIAANDPDDFRLWNISK
ncbi:MAG TPA: hypothetical protein VH105_05685 [Burkholderiales bacterium]|nr:hypothetical protein [Burkholderiales bacterium]